MRYFIYAEDGDVMRIVSRKEEAEHICANRRGWYWKARKDKPKPTFIFEEAPF